MDFRETVCRSADCINMLQDANQWGTHGSIHVSEFRDQISNIHFLRNDFAAWL